MKYLCLLCVSQNTRKITKICLFQNGTNRRMGARTMKADFFTVKSSCSSAISFESINFIKPTRDLGAGSFDRGTLPVSLKSISVPALPSLMYIFSVISTIDPAIATVFLFLTTGISFTSTRILAPSFPSTSISK